MYKKIILATSLIIGVSCDNQERGDAKAIEIVEKCIEQHGGKNYQDLEVSFDFRQFHVKLKQKGGVFLYERIFKDSANNEIHDLLANESFAREVNGKKQQLGQKDIDKYREGLNALAYFALLPYKLSEPAVRLKYLGETVIENKRYNKIGVSFEAGGGGKDHQDEFCYWINQDTYTMDFLSYASGGPRFRKAIKREKAGGVVFQDYENYEVQDTTLSTFNYDKAYTTGSVKLLSKIEQQNYTAN